MIATHAVEHEQVRMTAVDHQPAVRRVWPPRVAQQAIRGDGGGVLAQVEDNSPAGYATFLMSTWIVDALGRLNGAVSRNSQSSS